MTEIPFQDDFRGEIEIAILTSLLTEAEKPLRLCRDADEPGTRLEFRMSAIDKLQGIQQRLELLTQKLKAGIE